MIHSQLAVVVSLMTSVSSIERLAEFGNPVCFEKLSPLSSLLINNCFIFLGIISISGARASKAALVTKTDVVDLDASNFNSIVLDKTKDVLVEFYAPCKNTQYLLFLIFHM